MHNNDTIAVTFGFLIFIVLPALSLLARRFWLRANRTAQVEFFFHSDNGKAEVSVLADAARRPNWNQDQ